MGHYAKVKIRGYVGNTCGKCRYASKLYKRCSFYDDFIPFLDDDDGLTLYRLKECLSDETKFPEGDPKGQNEQIRELKEKLEKANEENVKLHKIIDNKCKGCEYEYF